MLNAKDLELLQAKGISEAKMEEQLACFAKGFPYLEIRIQMHFCFLVT